MHPHSEGVTTKRAVLAIMVSLAILVSMVTMVPVARAATSKPTWSVGDYWEYETNGTNVGPTTLSLGSGTVRYDVVGTDSITVGGTTFSAYHTKVNYSFSVSGSTFYLNGDEWFRTSDLAPAKESISTSIFSNTYTITITFIPPAQIQWPLNATSSWTVTTTINVTSNFPGFPGGNAAGSFNEAGQADTSFTVPAGTFTVTPVKDTTVGSSAYYMSYWSSASGNVVARRGYDSSGNTVGKEDLKSYSYGGGGGFSLSTVVAGLPLYAWLAIIVIVVVVIAAVALLRRKKPAPPMMPPPGMMPPGPGLPPVQPPQGPPPQP